MKLTVDADIEKIYQNNLELLNQLSEKEILVTGAAGFLGRYFMAVFNWYNLENPKGKIRVVGLDNYRTNSTAMDSSVQRTSEWNEWVFGDASIGAQLPNKFDYIVHAAGIASPHHYRARPLDTIDVAVNVTRSLLEKANTDKSKMLFFSSSEIYGDPLPQFIPTNEEYKGNVSSRGPRACYDESKRLGETLCWIYETYYSLHVSIARPFNIYGPGMLPNDFRVLPNFAASFIKNETLKVYGHGKQTRTFCYITDAMTGFLKILVQAKSPDVFNVGNPNPEISMMDLAKNLCQLTNHKPGFEVINYPSDYPEDEPNRRCPDISKISHVLGYAPEISLELGLTRFMNWVKDSYPLLDF